MKLNELISRDAIVAELRSEERDAAIMELIETIAAAGKIKDEHRDQAMLALLKREAVASTALGNGVAIPHAKVKFCSSFCGALGISRNGIDFGAADGQDVSVVFLFLSPEHAISGHLQLMAHIAAIARNARYVRLLKQAKTIREIERLIDDAETMLFAAPEEEPL
jgi:mannitol/fructose-specific phosphotransferase system IIA component (Ntr-type)